jgi:hypothetical protein
MYCYETFRRIVSQREAKNKQKTIGNSRKIRYQPLPVLIFIDLNLQHSDMYFVEVSN